VAWNALTGCFETSYPKTGDSDYYSITSTNPNDNNNQAKIERSYSLANCIEYDEPPDEVCQLIYENEEFRIYSEEEIATVFSTSFVHKFGKMDSISVKNVNLPPPPPVPPTRSQ